jgi:hypothetical protein
MTVDLPQLIVFGLLTASTHWLIARSEIARPLWSRARGGWEKLLRCPACSGFWLGLGSHLVGLHPVGPGFIANILTGILGAILTPIFESVLIWGLTNSAIEEEPADVSSSEDAVTPVDRPR